MKIVEKWINENVTAKRMEKCNNVMWTIVIEKDMPQVNGYGEAILMDRVVKVAFGSTYKTYTISYEYALGRVKTVFKSTKQKDVVQALEKFLKELN